MQPPNPLQLSIGPYQVHAAPTGLFALDGGAMFGTVPKVLWEKSNPADDKNRIAMEARALLLTSPGRNILVDVGIGGDFIEKYGEKLGKIFAEIYAVDASGITLESSLAQQGLTRDDITDVILTHLHFDHAGGATTFRDGRLQPTFPKARYYVQRRNLETAQQPNLRERASYYAPNFEPLIEAGVLTLLDGDTDEILPGISVRVSNGHTQGQQMVRIHDDKTNLVYCADVIPTSSHVRLAWVMGYDLDPLTLIEEKRQVLSPSADENWILFFEHDPYADAGRVERNQNDFRLKERLRFV
jgi:glyoxylase-like metal-dependent hydrolase (beta-lactamase superfamily II)